jgi:hypothetical protein
MVRITVSPNGNWRLYWGPGPLPAGAEALGTVWRDGYTGALLRMPTGVYVMGNAGSLRSLPPDVVPGEAEDV